MYRIGLVTKRLVSCGPDFPDKASLNNADRNFDFFRCVWALEKYS
jgi:hypothetical protein